MVIAFTLADDTAETPDGWLRVFLPDIMQACPIQALETERRADYSALSNLSTDGSFILAHLLDITKKSTKTAPSTLQKNPSKYPLVSQRDHLPRTSSNNGDTNTISQVS